MSVYDDTLEVVGYAVMMLQGYDEDETENATLDACRRMFDRAVKAEATRRVDVKIREFEKNLATEGKKVVDRVGWRKLCIEDAVKNFKSFDEWRAGF